MQPSSLSPCVAEFSKNSTFFTTHLYLDGNDLRGESGFSAIASATFLRKLLLVQTMIGEKEVFHLARLLQNPECQLRSLDLSFNRLCEPSVQSLSDALRENRSLLHLKIVKSFILHQQQ